MLTIDHDFVVKTTKESCFRCRSCPKRDKDSTEYCLSKCEITTVTLDRFQQISIQIANKYGNVKGKLG